MTTTPPGRYVTRPLTRETWPDFAALVEENNGVWGGCWCMGFHREGIGKASTVEGNRDAKRAHVNEGTVHQILVYLDGECVGWCQYGPPAEVARIQNPKAYEKELVELPDWRIGCVFTGSRHRREGVARAGLAAALAAISQAGGGTVEAYPEQLDGRGPQRGAYLHTGPEDLFDSRQPLHARWLGHRARAVPSGPARPARRAWNGPSRSDMLLPRVALAEASPGRRGASRGGSFVGPVPLVTVRAIEGTRSTPKKLMTRTHILTQPRVSMCPKHLVGR